MLRRIAEFCEKQPVSYSSPSFENEVITKPKWSIPESRDFLERHWNLALGQLTSPPLTETMTYALSGGKYLRGLLLLAVVGSCNGTRAGAADAAISIEMLHAASLVVDDLPSLDDAAMRRNAPSLHRRFGERAAILTAHALVAAAFELIARIPNRPDRLLRTTCLLSRAIGGMANGELLGTVPHNRAGASAANARVRALKTGGLFELTASIGALLAGARPELTVELGRLGLQLGICYQLSDDLRDDVMNDDERAQLSQECLENWRACDALFHSIRKRLHWPFPLEEWMAEFHLAGAEAGVS